MTGVQTCALPILDVRIDAATLPKGYVLTVPAIQTTLLAHHHIAHIDFGIVANSEVSGIVFIDKDQNGRFSDGDTGLRDVVLSLENGASVKTDGAGRYFFRRASPGEHTVTLDINSIPVHYLPEVSIKKELTLFEGMTFKYNIPLKEIKE